MGRAVSRVGTRKQIKPRATGPISSAKEIDEVVSQLRGVCRDSSLEFALRVGAVVISNFYAGDTEAWRARGPKLNSFRRLAEHPELPLSPGALYRCVAVFELCERLNAASRWQRLGVSHLRAVIGIPGQHQERLLAAANAQDWSVQHLQSVARSFRSSNVRGGRRPSSAMAKENRVIEQRLESLGGALEECVTLQRADLEESYRILLEIKGAVERLVHRVAEQRDVLARTDSHSRS